MDSDIFFSFCREMEKTAIKLRVVHGTNQALQTIAPRHAIGKASVLARDPNPSMVYMAPSRKGGKNVAGFARDAAARYGGKPTILKAKVDTKKGWSPARLTRWGREEGYDLEDLQDIIDQLDDPSVVGSERAELWETLNRASGAITNVDPNATVRVNKVRRIK